MTPVDLNRLREAMDAFTRGDSPRLYDLAEDVLDAPTVWWCAAHECSMWRDVVGDGEWKCDRAGLPLYREPCERIQAKVVPVKGES